MGKLRHRGGCSLEQKTGDRQRLEPTKPLWAPWWGQVPGAGGHLPFRQSNPGSRTTKCRSFRGEVRKGNLFIHFIQN